MRILWHVVITLHGCFLALIIWQFHIAMENHTFDWVNHGRPSIHSPFDVAMWNYPGVFHLCKLTGNNGQ